MKKTVFIGMLFLYEVLTLVANYIASWLGLAIPRKVFSGLISSSPAIINTVGVLTIVPLTLFIAWGILYLLFFKRQFPKLYEPSEKSKPWRKRACMVILPGELVRFFACLVTLGFSDSTGLFAAIPTYLFEMTYLKWFDRAEAVRQMGEFIFADYAGYTVCYAVYMLVHLLGIFFICKTVWKQTEEEHGDLIRPETKVKYY